MVIRLVAVRACCAVGSGCRAGAFIPFSCLCVFGDGFGPSFWVWFRGILGSRWVLSRTVVSCLRLTFEWHAVTTLLKAPRVAFERPFIFTSFAYGVGFGLFYYCVAPWVLARLLWFCVSGFKFRMQRRVFFFARRFRVCV